MPTPKAGAAPRRTAGRQLNLRVTPDTQEILARLCGRRAEEYAARGITRDPARLQSEVVTELLHRAGAGR